MNFNFMGSTKPRWYPAPAMCVPSNHTPAPVPVQYQAATATRDAPTPVLSQYPALPSSECASRPAPAQYQPVSVAEHAPTPAPMQKSSATRAALPPKQRGRKKQPTTISTSERQKGKRLQDRNSQRNFRQRQKDLIARQEAQIRVLEEKTGLLEAQLLKSQEIIERQNEIVWQENQTIEQQGIKLETQQRFMRTPGQASEDLRHTLRQAISTPQSLQAFGPAWAEAAMAMCYPRMPCEYPPPAGLTASLHPVNSSVFEMVPPAPYANMGSTGAMLYQAPLEVGQGQLVEHHPAGQVTANLDFSGDHTAGSDSSSQGCQWVTGPAAGSDSSSQGYELVTNAAVVECSGGSQGYQAGTDSVAVDGDFWDHEWERYGYSQVVTVSSSPDS